VPLARLDLDAYLQRIGLSSADASSWPAVHRAHVTSIPFENLDSHRGIPVSLQPEDLERKLVAERRGGYCFEHNLLLAAAVEELGLQVEPMLARVRRGGAPPKSRPTGPDPAFGPDPDSVHEQSGWSFRIVEDGPELVLQERRFQLGEDGRGPLSVSAST
jgi:arylamine N-acetyltransferase